MHGHEDDRVCAFMAGGDVALVHALEGFEDATNLRASRAPNPTIWDFRKRWNCVEPSIWSVILATVCSGVLPFAGLRCLR